MKWGYKFCLMLFGKLSYEMELQILIHQQVLYEIGEELSV